jgi:hypothetical protein
LFGSPCPECGSTVFYGGLRSGVDPVNNYPQKAAWGPLDRIAWIQSAREGLPLVDCSIPLRGSSLTDAEAVELDRLFQALADRHRVKILNMLVRASGEPVCVCEFVPTLGPP